MIFTPYEDRVLARAHQPDTWSDGGIYLPPTAQDRPITGTVLAVGPGHTYENGTTIPPDLHPGDTILYTRYAGTEILAAGEDVLLLHPRDILAKIPDTPDNTDQTPQST